MSNIVCNESYELGKFNVCSSSIRFSDPCYKVDTWCAGELPAVNGMWDSNIGLFRCPNDERDLIIHIKTLHLMKNIYLDSKDDIMNLYTLINALNKTENTKTLQSVYDNCIKTEKDKEYIDLLVNEFNNLYDGEVDYCDKESWTFRRIVCLFHNMMSNSLHHFILIKELTQSESNNEKAIQFAVSNIGLNIDNNISSAEECYNNGKPKRTMYLRIKHSSINEYTSLDSNLWENVTSFNVGVDSGQAGFFDSDWFKKYSDTYDTHEWEQTYSMLCALSSDSSSYRNANNPSKKDGGSFEFGCNSYTAYGDGSANLYVIKDEHGNVVEAVYLYCEEEEDE